MEQPDRVSPSVLEPDTTIAGDRFVDVALAGALYILRHDEPFAAWREIAMTLNEVDVTSMWSTDTIILEPDSSVDEELLASVELLSLGAPSETDPSPSNVAMLNELVRELEAGLGAAEIGQLLADFAETGKSPVPLESAPGVGTLPPSTASPEGDAELTKLAFDVASAVDQLVPPRPAFVFPFDLDESKAIPAFDRTALPSMSGRAARPAQRTLRSGSGTSSATKTGMRKGKQAPATPAWRKHPALLVCAGLVAIGGIALALSGSSTPPVRTHTGYQPTYVASKAAGVAPQGGGSQSTSGSGTSSSVGSGGGSSKFPPVRNVPRQGASFSFSATGSAQSSDFTLNAPSTVSWTVTCVNVLASESVSMSIDAGGTQVLELVVPLKPGNQQSGTGSVLPAGTYTVSSYAPSTCSWSLFGTGPHSPTVTHQPPHVEPPGS